MPDVLPDRHVAPATIHTKPGPDFDQLLHDIFVTALEGGVQYWAGVIKYRWATLSTRNELHKMPDLETFEAVIQDVEVLDGPTLVVDRDRIEKGLRLIVEGKAEVNDRILADCVRAWISPADADLDADAADCIVQVAFFGEVIYG